MEPKTTVSLDIPKPIEAACKRMTHLMESKYLPAQIEADINTLVRAALAWEMATQYRDRT